jgi:hypothetical protein
MHQYLSQRNLISAVALGFLITIMTIPRLVVWGVPLGLYIPASFLSMTLVSGTATAWGTSAGMCGPFPEQRRQLAGIAIAAALALLALPLFMLCVDPVMVPALSATGNEMLLRHYPVTPDGKIALLLWSAGFETMFFHAGAMSLVSRITRRQWVAVTACVALRLFIASHQLAELHIPAANPFLLVVSGVVTTASCLLFARFGLPTAMVFSAGICLNVMFR